MTLKAKRIFESCSVVKNLPITVLFCLSIALLCTSVPASFANSPAFDLIGPQIKMTVTRDSKTLPISRVSDLQPGDKLWIHPEFPDDQSARYLLIVAFLQGPTNPPPEGWFTRAETWNKETREKGTWVTVPQGAEQAVMFLAPETGGDFATLRSTVRGRPGLFVRATVDLEQASLDRTRLDKYLEEVRKTYEFDSASLKKRSTLLAQTLRIKLNEECFNKPLEEQSSCLTQDTDQLVINDSHDQTLVATLTSGASSDLITALGSTPAIRGGYFSPYVGAIVDAVRLLGSLHTATYQYIPALSLPDKDLLNLKLNAPPSFRNPKSVLVVGLPPIGPPSLPSLQNVQPKQVLCLQQVPLILPVEGAPLVFSTSLAHDFVFRVEGKTGGAVDLPATAEALRGGFVVDTHNLHGSNLGPKLTGTLRGSWGFASFEGPAFQLHNANSARWTIHPLNGDSVVVGRESTIQLQTECVACVEKVALVNASGKDLKAAWKTLGPDQLEVELPLEHEHPGQIELKVAQFGLSQPDVIPVPTFAEAAHLEHFKIYSGDQQGVLSGTHLEQVSCLELEAVCFAPSKESRLTGSSLDLVAENPGATYSLQPGATLSARVTLNDGRVLEVPATVETPRPKIALVSKNLQQPSAASTIRVGNPDELPQDGRLSFFLRADVPPNFPLSEKVEVATEDGAFSTMLSVSAGTLILQDANSALAVFDPLKAFGPAAFGPLHFRPVDADGAKGDWQPFAVLVRIPSLTEIHCPNDPDKPCTLHGSNLFLMHSVSADPKFLDSVAVPAGYVGDSLTVPRPNGTLLYIKLRDDPATVDTVTLPVLPDNR
ncbi:MAG TPA: hypothetical protein VKB61_06820 [Candidatus Acidoferrum sp.]|nr:hypothetical protein [Candidatus Acidoferrum sp.]